MPSLRSIRVPGARPALAKSDYTACPWSTTGPCDGGGIAMAGHSPHCYGGCKEPVCPGGGAAAHLFRRGGMDLGGDQPQLDDKAGGLPPPQGQAFTLPILTVLSEIQTPGCGPYSA